MGVFAGVDGCRDGWLVVTVSGHGRLLGRDVHRRFAGAVEATAGAELVLVDIPIGLRDGGREERLCDLAARRLLGPKRGSSVFPAPSRPALAGRDYAEASRLNDEAAGRRLSVQSHAILDKVREVDEEMGRRAGLQARVRESHPEICFAALNGWRPLAEGKKRAVGRRLRADLLSERVPPGDVAEVLRRAGGPRFAADDALDALVLAVSARLAAGRGCPSLPPRPQVDRLGLRMEMVCPDTSPGCPAAVWIPGA